MTDSPSIQPAPWEAEYLPYTSQDDREIPNFRINDANMAAVCETNEDLPEDVQAKAAYLIAAAPELFDALEYVFNILHDYESSLDKGYIEDAFQKARTALAKAKGGNP